MGPPSLPDRIAALAALDDPTRRAVFDLVAQSATAVSRDAAADALGVSKRVAALHLDRLADHGLLTVEYRRPPGRTGPGAGRPTKLYRRAEGETAVSVPERHYDLVGGLLAEAVTESIERGAPVQDVLPRVAYQTGQTIGAHSGNLFAALEETGYEPRRSQDDDATLALGNCPFHRLAQQSTALICEVNLQLLRGVVDGAGDAYLARRAPSPNHCCVRLRPSSR